MYIKNTQKVLKNYTDSSNFKNLAIWNTEKYPGCFSSFSPTVNSMCVIWIDTQAGEITIDNLSQSLIEFLHFVL